MFTWLADLTPGCRTPRAAQLWSVHRFADWIGLGIIFVGYTHNHHSMTIHFYERKLRNGAHSLSTSVS